MNGESLAGLSDYLFNHPTIAISLVAILFLYFGYYSTLYKPIRATKIEHYLSGFQFLVWILIIPLIIVYLISDYLRSLELFQFEFVDILILLLIFYHSSMIIKSTGIKENMNHNSYDYKGFYTLVSKMNLIQYSILLFPIKITQKNWIDAFENKNGFIPEFLKNNKRLREKFQLIIQWIFFGAEVWVNSLLILIFFYIITISYIPTVLGILLSIYLFFALTSVAIEYSIWHNGFLLIKVFLKEGSEFKGRLMRMDKNFLKVLLKGEKLGKKFNPIEYIPISEISKIRYTSEGEMLDEF